MVPRPSGAVPDQPNYTVRKTIELPLYEVFCQDPVHKRVNVLFALIMDTSDPVLAANLGANYAPELANADPANTQVFWFIEGGPYNCQKPVIEYCPVWFRELESHPSFSPVMEFVRAMRTGVPPSTTINNPEYLQYLVGLGLLTPLVDDAYINANRA